MQNFLSDRRPIDERLGPTNCEAMRPSDNFRFIQDRVPTARREKKRVAAKYDRLERSTVITYEIRTSEKRFILYNQYAN